MIEVVLYIICYYNIQYLETQLKAIFSSNPRIIKCLNPETIFVSLPSVYCPGFVFEDHAIYRLLESLVHRLGYVMFVVYFTKPNNHP